MESRLAFRYAKSYINPQDFIKEIHMSGTPNFSRRAVIGCLTAILKSAAMPLLAEERTSSNDLHQVAAIRPLQMSDQRELDRDGVQSVAAHLSGIDDSQVIVLYGPTRETFREVVEAAEIALNSDDNTLSWVIVANGDRAELAFYHSGMLTSTLLNISGEDLSDVILNQLRHDNVRVPDLLGSIEGPPANENNF